MGPKYGAVPDEEKTSINPTSIAILGDEDSKERKILMNPSFRSKEHAKVTKLLDKATDRAPPAIVEYLKMAQPVTAGCIVGCAGSVRRSSLPRMALTCAGAPSARSCEACMPIYVRIFALCARFVAALPQEELGILLGLLLCFFGGMYPMTMAACEALRQCGGELTIEAVHDLYAEFLNAKAASDEDDKVDDDGDGALARARARAPRARRASTSAMPLGRL